MEEQFEQALEEMLEFHGQEVAELRKVIANLQSLAKRQRVEYLLERRWRLKFQMDFLQAEAVKTEAELKELGFGSKD